MDRGAGWATVHRVAETDMTATDAFTPSDPDAGATGLAWGMHQRARLCGLSCLPLCET